MTTWTADEVRRRADGLRKLLAAFPSASNDLPAMLDAFATSLDAPALTRAQQAQAVVEAAKKLVAHEPTGTLAKLKAALDALDALARFPESVLTRAQAEAKLTDELLQELQCSAAGMTCDCGLDGPDGWKRFRDAFLDALYGSSADHATRAPDKETR